jgi:hypothetical protein
MRDDPIGLEALSHQVAIETLELTVVGDTVPAMQPLLESGCQKRVWIEICERLVDGLRRNARRDSCGLDLLPNTKLPATTNGRLPAGDQRRHAQVVDAAIGFQARNGDLD